MREETRIRTGKGYSNAFALQLSLILASAISATSSCAGSFTRLFKKWF